MKPLSEYSTEVLQLELLTREARGRKQEGAAMALQRRKTPPCAGCLYDAADGALLARCPAHAALHEARRKGAATAAPAATHASLPPRPQPAWVPTPAALALLRKFR